MSESPLDKVAGAVDELMDPAAGDEASAAFDISFMYNGEEVQPAVDPATGAAYAVQVTFTPAADSTLADADALQVYHITNGETGLNEDAVKTADTVKAEPVEVTASEDGTVTVAADNFSIYVISTNTMAEKIGASYTVTPGTSIDIKSDETDLLGEWKVEKKVGKKKYSKSKDIVLELNPPSIEYGLMSFNATVSPSAKADSIYRVVHTWCLDTEYFYIKVADNNCSASATTQITVIAKNWTTTGDTTPPTSLDVTLKNGGTIVDTQTLSGPDWTYTWDNLPNNGTYTVEEVCPENYTPATTTTAKPLVLNSCQIVNRCNQLSFANWTGAFVVMKKGNNTNVWTYSKLSPENKAAFITAFNAESKAKSFGLDSSATFVDGPSASIAGMMISSSPNTITFGAKSDWSKFAYGTYDDAGQTINLSNTYVPPVPTTADYTVEYYAQINGGGYTKVTPEGTVPTGGTADIGTTTDVTAPSTITVGGTTYSYKSADPAINIKINADSTLNIIKLYYDCSQYSVAYNWSDAPGGQTLPTNPNTYATEADAKATQDITFTSTTTVYSTSGKYVFSGWREDTNDNLPYTLTFTGTWAYTAASTTENTARFTVNKVDENETPLPGASFVLTKDSQTISPTANTEGTSFTFTGLTEGTYTLTETAPRGYEAAGPWTVMVSKNGEATITGPNESTNNVIRKVWDWVVNIFTGASADNLLTAGTLTVANEKLYSVTYKAGEGTGSDFPGGSRTKGTEYTVAGFSDTSFKLPTHKHFTGWALGTGSATAALTGTASQPAGDVIYVAQYENDATYKVSYYNDDYVSSTNRGTPIESPYTGLYTGYDIPAPGVTTPSKTSPVGGTTYTFTGWELVEGTVGDIGKVGTTDLVYKAVYSANAAGRYSVIYTDGLTGGETYTDKDNVPTNTRYAMLTDNATTDFSLDGYSFAGWKLRDGSTVNGSGSELYGDSGATIYYDAQWHANDGISYKVEYFKQKTDGSYPTDPSDSADLAGTTNTAATFTVKDYSGYAYDAGITTYQNKNTPAQTAALMVAGDGSLVIKLYYTRNTGDLTLTKTISGNYASYAANTVFTFTITAPETLNRTYATSNEQTTVKFENSTTATVTITGAGSITIYGLPTGDYKISEGSAIVHGITPSVTYKDSDDGNESDQMVTVKFVRPVSTLALASAADDNADNAVMDVTNTYTYQDSGYVPTTNIPEPTTPTTDIPEPTTPTTDVPEPTTPTTDISDPDTPKADASEQTTGDELYLWIALAGASGLSLAWLVVSDLKRRKGTGDK